MTARVQLKKENSSREPQGAWRQVKLICGNPPVVNKFDFELVAAMR
jgi:hypothetical protein